MELRAGDSRGAGARSRPDARTLLRIGLIGAALAVVVALGGWILQRTRLGADETVARARVQAEVQAVFARLAEQLRTDSQGLFRPDLVRAAGADDPAAARALFAAANDTLGDDTAADAGLTVFAGEGGPTAWAGTPSEPPPGTLAGNESWLLSRLPLGGRLVYARPVVDGSQRVGTIVAERALIAADRLPRGVAALLGDDEPMILPTRLGPVEVRVPGEAPDQADAFAFEIAAPSGQPLAIASITGSDLGATRARWRRATWSISLMILAVTAILCAGPLLDWRNRARRPSDYAAATLLTAAAIVGARVIARIASPADWSNQPLFTGAGYAGTLVGSLLTSPFDFLLTAAAAGGLVALFVFTVEAWRLHAWRGRRRLATSGDMAAYGLRHVAAGLLVALVFGGYEALLRDTIENSTLDLLDFSLQRWDTALVALQVGLVIAHAAALALTVGILRAAWVRWKVGRNDRRVGALTIVCWVAPLVVWRFARDRDPMQHLPLLAAATAAVLLTVYATRLFARYRHGSQAFRLTLLTLGLIVPAAAFYPTIFQLAWQAKSQLVEGLYAPQALDHRENVIGALNRSLDDIDRMPGLADLAVAPAAGGVDALTDRAFRVWQGTALANYPVTSSVELFGPDGTLVSRFAFNLPEDPTVPPQAQERSCTWETFGEVNLFFAEERRLLHAGRQLCDAGGRPRGAIVIHAILTDYENLPFIPSRSPYVELVRAPEPQREGFAGRDVEFAVYGWSRTPLYASRDTAWSLPDGDFARAVDSREPFWTELRRGNAGYDTYILNDRGGIYALGFPVVSALDHLVHLAEITVLGVLTYLLLLAANAVFGSFSRRGTTAPALLREIRASFYRKLFIAFVLAVFVPVVALAIATRVYVADRMRVNIEDEAVRTASAAGRVVQDLVAPRAAEEGLAVDDNLMVWVSRLVDEDVNMFAEGRLVATSERNLFASGFLPTRTPADVYEALELRREASTVIRERVGSLSPYLVAAIRFFEQGILTVPLTARQQEIEQEIMTLDRRVLLAALLFILAGAGLGYSMAERISDPVNRLTRATRRIARGDLTARIAATSSDELRRLVEDFNSMARDLQRQRVELERTNRLTAWAEMARQVAHEIKNPLTPIQLNAEHLRRVHADRGEPLSPVLQQCVDTILTQVRLLRQIASEFSSFAASPTARPAPVDIADMLREVIDPYRAGLAGRIEFDLDVTEPLPPVHVDRTLIARSLTNIVENALHAMPGAGTLSVSARAANGRVHVRVADTGVGMDAEALGRVFEPYFSTKATGTGLGLPIAKRNVELNGGTIEVASERDRGTTVELTLPVYSGGT